MSKYIIKNCPAYQKVGVRGSNGKITVIEEVENYCLKEVNNCVACTDCLLKQVIERCKQSLNYSSKEPYELGRTNMAGVILAYFEIEEC